MTTPTYFAMGGVVFVKEHSPITLQKAALIASLHRMNAAHWLTEGDERTLARRIAIARAEQSLADEMAEAIRAATQPEQKEAA